MKIKTFTLLLYSLLFFFSVTNAQSYANVRLDSAKVASFLDSLITKEMSEQNIPGCAITIVKDSSILFSKGYGYSDVENEIPVDPDKTLFRTASICKTVTATVVMMARDEKLVDMNTDINQYLTLFKIPEKYNKPITLRNLLTHTPGFDDVYIGKSARTKEEGIPLGEFLKEILPDRIMPPGEIYCYSNLGNALAGYVVEEASGKDFEKYAIEHLFKPLEMNSSSYTLHDFQKENLYKGYYNDNGELVEFSFDHLNDYPAGQMLSPVNEFANFMIMHLNNGKFNGKQIIDSTTINEMHSVQFTENPKLKGGSGYAFGVGEHNGLKSLGHGGGYVGISTLLYLFPEIKLGIYIAVNTSSGLPAIVTFQFLDKFFPHAQSPSDAEYPLTTLPDYDKNVEPFKGMYRFTRYSHNSFTKIGVLVGMLGDEMPIWTNDEGMIEMYDHNGEVRRLIQVEPLLFQSIDDDYYVAFHAKEDGTISHVFTNTTTSLEKVEWYEELWFNRILFFTLLTIFVLAHIIFLVYFLRHRKDEKKTRNYQLLRCSAFIGGTYLIYYIFLAVIMGFLIPSVELQMGMSYGLPWYFYLLQLIPFVGISATLVLIWTIIKEIKNFKKTALGISLSVITILASLANIWFMYYWSILGWSF